MEKWDLFDENRQSLNKTHNRQDKMVINEYHIDNRILLHDRVKKDWCGLTFPGGHVEREESFVQAIIREIYEETGLTIKEPKLCGVKKFQTDQDERYIILLFKTDKFEGNLISSAEGEMRWVDRNSLNDYTLVDDFME